MSYIRLKQIQCENSTILYRYEVSQEIQKYFNLEEEFFVDYTEDLEGVPNGILAIPFVTNILPIIWLTDSILYIDELDEIFYKSINEFKKGYSDMYPDANFKGKVIVENIIDYSYINSHKSATLYSGGVDATSTLVSRIDEQPDLVTLWGADIGFEDEEGWNRVKLAILETAKMFNLNTIFVKSAFRRVIREGILDKEFKRVLNQDGWWHGVQHGIALLGHTAPYAYAKKVSTVYIPSSFAEQDKNVSCASYPTIDENVKWSGCKVVHEGFSYNRQEKIRNIVEISRKIGLNPQLRVCWQSVGGGNCCICEKCARTIMGIIGEKQDPNQYGFNITSKSLRNIKNLMRYELTLNMMTIRQWQDIQKVFIQDKEFWNKNSHVKWMITMNFERLDKSWYKIINKIFRKINRLLKGRY